LTLRSAGSRASRMAPKCATAACLLLLFTACLAVQASAGHTVHPQPTRAHTGRLHNRDCVLDKRVMRSAPCVSTFGPRPPRPATSTGRRPCPATAALSAAVRLTRADAPIRAASRPPARRPAAWPQLQARLCLGEAAAQTLSRRAVLLQHYVVVHTGLPACVGLLF